MLKKQDNRRQIQLPWQINPPNFAEIEFLLEQASQNAGKTIELVFGKEPVMYALTVLRHRSKDDAQWMFYQVDQGSSALGWSQMTGDCSMIHAAICAQFPEVDLDIVGQGGGLGGALTFEMGSATATQDMPTTYVAKDAARTKTLMEGQLEHIHVSNVLQSVGSGKMTGRLEITSDKDIANLFFSEGVVMHCTIQGLEGEPAFLEVVAWKGGFYRFFQEPPATRQTIKRRMETLLLEGAALEDQHAYLISKGFKPDAYVLKMHANISEQVFEQTASKSTPCSMALLKSVYQTMDNNSTWLEVLRRKPLGKPDWVPALHNMVNCGLVSFGVSPHVQEVDQVDLSQVRTIKIDWAQVRQAEKSLIRSDTGLLSYPSFLGFLEREHQRFEVLYRPYSLVIMELAVKRSDTAQIEPLSIKTVKEIVTRLDSIRRKCDTVGHLETFGLAMLLPETNGASVRNFVRIATDVILAEGTTDEGHRIIMRIGFGTVPDDCRRLEALLSVAKPTA